MKVNAAKLKQAIEKTLPFGHRQDELHERWPNDVVLLRFETGKVMAVATDGHRLALSEFPEALTLLSPVEIVLSAAALLDLLPSLNDGDAELDLDKLARKQVKKGNFPNWQSVLPREEEWTHLAVTDRDLLRVALKRALIIADDRSHAIVLDLSPERVTVFAKSNDNGEFDETLAANTSGEPLRVGFSGCYLLEFLKVAAPGPIHMTFRDDTSIGDFRALGEEDVSYRYLLMPMRV